MIYPDQQNTCAIVVTHHPDATLRDRLEILVHQVRQVIVVDNSSDEAGRNSIAAARSAFPAQIVVVENCENIGVAAALNRGFAAVRTREVAWVLCLDQDSTVLPDLMATVLDASGSYCGTAPVAIISVFSGIEPLAGVEPPFGELPYAEVITAITSGSLISMEAFKRVRGFREELFIDSVDHDFCFRVLDAGYRILLTRKPGMKHAIGSPAQRKFLWKRPTSSNHSALRRYYMSRNRMIIFREQARKRPTWVKEMKRLHWHEVIRWCLIEDDRARKVYATLLGTWHGIRGKLGKLDSPVIR